MLDVSVPDDSNRPRSIVALLPSFLLLFRLLSSLPTDFLEWSAGVPLCRVCVCVCCLKCATAIGEFSGAPWFFVLFCSLSLSRSRARFSPVPPPPPLRPTPVVFLRVFIRFGACCCCCCYRRVCAENSRDVRRSYGGGRIGERSCRSSQTPHNQTR